MMRRSMNSQVLPEGQDWFTIATSPANSTLVSLRGGSPNTTATFRMRTVRPDGHSEWTEVVEVTLPSGFAIEAGRFVGGTVGEPLTGPALQIYTTQGEGTASSFGVTDLPPGWDFDPTTGVISGSPTAPGVYRPMVSATDGTDTATTFVTFRVKPATAGPEEQSPVPDYLFLAPPSGQIRHDLAPHFRDPDTATAIRFETNLGGYRLHSLPGGLPRPCRKPPELYRPGRLQRGDLPSLGDPCLLRGGSGPGRSHETGRQRGLHPGGNGPERGR